jgi:hypothetical protein
VNGMRKRYRSTKYLSEKYGICQRAVRYWIEKGHVEAKRYKAKWYIDEAEADEFFQMIHSTSAEKDLFRIKKKRLIFS